MPKARQRAAEPRGWQPDLDLDEPVHVRCRSCDRRVGRLIAGVDHNWRETVYLRRVANVEISDAPAEVSSDGYDVRRRLVCKGSSRHPCGAVMTFTGAYLADLVDRARQLGSEGLKRDPLYL